MKFYHINETFEMLNEKMKHRLRGLKNDFLEKHDAPRQPDSRGQTRHVDQTDLIIQVFFKSNRREDGGHAL